MAITAIVHLQGEDAFLADLDEVPDPNHTYVLMRNLRKKDGKPLSYVADGATAVLYSWTRITFMELMGDVPVGVQPARNGASATSVLGFFRDDGSS